MKLLGTVCYEIIRYLERLQRCTVSTCTQRYSVITASSTRWRDVTSSLATDFKIGSNIYIYCHAALPTRVLSYGYKYCIGLLEAHVRAWTYPAVHTKKQSIYIRSSLQYIC